MNTADPREELGHFLYERRTSLTREDVGLPPTSSRRRTPGLRREEVAERAEIGPSLYTRIEQGCHIGVSQGSRCLHCAPTEILPVKHPTIPTGTRPWGDSGSPAGTHGSG